MPHITCDNSAPLAVAIMLTLTLTLLVTSANGFNVLRHESHRQPSVRELQARATRRSAEQTGAGSRFVIVLDAGSSSTKANVYEFEAAEDGELPASVTEVSTGEVKVKPSLDTFADKSVEDLRSYFSDVFASLASKVSQPGRTSLYVLATAGMRELRETDADKARGLVRNVQSILSDTTLNPYSFHENNVRIISGKEEGIYAWMAANFLKGFFHSAALSRADSVGVLEMGGSSLQTAYMLAGPSSEGCEVQVDSRSSRIHVDSYAGFGASGVVDQVLETACGVGRDGGSGGVENPCVLKGDSAQVTCDGSDQKVAVDGTGNPAECTAMLGNIVEGSVGDQSAGPLLFYAIGAFRHSLKTLHAVDDSGILDIGTLRQNAENYCQMTWRQAADYKGSEKYVSDDCIQGLFTEELLEGLDLDDNVIKVSQDINGKKISWALGAALDFTAGDISLHCNVGN